MARYRLTLSTSQPDNEPVPELLRDVVEAVAYLAADLLGEDVVFDAESGVRTSGGRGLGVAPFSFDDLPEIEDDVEPVEDDLSNDPYVTESE